MTDITGEIFDYKKLIEKLEREIDRLCEAQEAANSTDSLDHALNAAFTGFHLLEWEEKHHNPSSKTKARTILDNKNDQDLNLLHDIVTRTKHMSVSKNAYHDDLDVRVSVGNTYSSSINEHGETAYDRQRKVFVKFGDNRAERVLKDVLQKFKNRI